MKYLLAVLCCFLSASVVTGQPAAPEDGPFDPGIELPPGPGRELVETACTRCHDLKGLSAYAGYWNRARWRAMVETMVENGARLNSEQKERVADYLAEHYGRQGQ